MSEAGASEAELAVLRFAGSGSRRRGSHGLGLGEESSSNKPNGISNERLKKIVQERERGRMGI